jgi:3-hydroxybutyryl-CoA dehydratase
MIPETPKVGDALPSLDKAMTQGIIDAWADVSGDRNPLHVDPEYARTTRYGGTIAHGHIALSHLCQLMLGWAGPAWMRGGRLVDIRFIAPIRPGRTYNVGGEIATLSDVEVGVKLHIRDSSDGRDCIEGTAVCPRRSN